MLRSKSLPRLVLAAVALLLPVLAAAGEDPAPVAPAVLEAAPAVAQDANMTPVVPQTVPDPLFASTYWCTHSVQNCGTTWGCGKTCLVGQNCGCVFQYGQTPEGACITRLYGSYCY